MLVSSQNGKQVTLSRGNTLTSQANMDKADAFDQACRDRGIGKRLDIENFPDVPAATVYEHTRTIANELIESVLEHLPNAKPIHFDFIRDPQINAYAFREGSDYYIGINAGAILLLHLVVDHIFASRHTFPLVGDAKAERETLPPVPWSNVNAESLFLDGVQPLGANSKERILLGRAIVDQAVMFLVGHEIAHITRGHVDFLLDELNAAYVSEKDTTEDVDAKLVRQSIEVDADYRSVQARCYSMHLTAKQNHKIVPIWSETPVSEQEYQYYALFAINVIFRLFGDKQFNFDELEQDSYPPLPLRRWLAMDHAANLMRSNWPPGSDSLISEAVMGSIKACEASFNAIGAEPSEGGFTQAFTEEATEHMRKIGTTYKEIVPKLQVFAAESLGGAE